MAFDHSRRSWFGTCSCKPVPRGLPSSVEQLHTSRPLRPSLRSWRTIVRKTTLQKPPNATHWSRRTKAQQAGVSASTVGRIWRAPGRKPHGVHTFKLSNDPRCAAKLDDIVRLYLPPPEHALVLSRAEKSQIQALDRSQPGLPLKKGRGQTMTHD